MSYAQGRTLYDADSHIMELPDFLSSYADPDVRDQIPAISFASGGKAYKQFEELLTLRAQPKSRIDEITALGDRITYGPKGYFALGAFNPSERTQALDQLGFRKQLVFSTFSASVAFRTSTPVPLRYATARAHNRAVAEFCAGDPRLMGVAALPLDDTELALAEIAQMVKLGLPAAWVPHRPIESGTAPALRGGAQLESGTAPALRGGAQLESGTAPALRGGAQLESGTAPALRGGAQLESGTAPALRGGAQLESGTAPALRGGAHCGGRSPGHDALDPVWAALADAGIPFLLHVGGIPLQVDPAWMNTGRPVPTDWLGGGENVRGKDMTSLHHEVETFLGCLVLDGVLQRHPTLRGGAIELGAGWVPSMLRRLDWSAEIWRKSEPDLAALKSKPSEQIIGRLGFTPFVYEDVGELIQQSDPSLYLFSSDYPHIEGGRNPLGRFDSALETSSEADKQQFFAGNFAQLFGL